MYDELNDLARELTRADFAQYRSFGGRADFDVWLSHYADDYRNAS